MRNRRLVYELSTGNTEVGGLAWDGQRNTLYAATECNYLGRMGDHYGYRVAKRPKPPQEALGRARNNDTKFKKTKTVYRDSSDHEEGDGDEHMGEEVEYWEDYNTEDEFDSDEEEVFYEAHETKCWPSRAHHPENHFRRMHDAGEHCLCKQISYCFNSLCCALTVSRSQIAIGLPLMPTLGCIRDMDKPPLNGIIIGDAVLGVMTS